MKSGAKFAFVALALALGSAAGWVYSIRSVAIPENRIFFVVAFLAAVVLGLIALFRRPGWFGGVAAAVAIAVGSLLPLTMAVSTQELAADAIEVGDTIPRFTAPDEHGELFDSRALNGHLVLIKFFRAHW